MDQSPLALLILTLSNWYSLEQRAINAIANFGEAGKAIINNTPYVLEGLCQSAVVYIGKVHCLVFCLIQLAGIAVDVL